MNKATKTTAKILLQRPSNKKILSLILLGAFITSFALRYFVLHADVFSAGLGGMNQGISYTL
jgi:uncharacterized membrane-anchored protein YitT (DUF2179 family)